MLPAIFLDRDGVLNEAKLVRGVPVPPAHIENVNILEGVKESIELLTGSGYTPVVISNQPDIARGKTTFDEVLEINNYISIKTGIKHFYFCPHDDVNQCECRKPKPGLILNAANELDLDLTASYLVGDRWRDIQAGQSLNLGCFFIDYSYPEKRPQSPYTKVRSLREAVEILMKVSKPCS
jgi:D-glycero-D-manno-heptose 1,7-bisphosphate phosphatase